MYIIIVIVIQNYILLYILNLIIVMRRWWRWCWWGLMPEDKGCPPTMVHVDLGPHPDYIDISQLINTFNAGVFIEGKLFIVRLFSMILIKMIEIEIKPLLGQLTLSIW